MNIEAGGHHAFWILPLNVAIVVMGKRKRIEGRILSRAPQSMKIAVPTDGKILTLAGECCFRFHPWLEMCPHDPTVGQDLDPLDIVFLLHGVCDTADLHQYAGRGLFHDGDMLLPGSVTVFSTIFFMGSPQQTS